MITRLTTLSRVSFQRKTDVERREKNKKIEIDFLKMLKCNSIDIFTFVVNKRLIIVYVCRHISYLNGKSTKHKRVNCQFALSFDMATLRPLTC